MHTQRFWILLLHRGRSGRSPISCSPRDGRREHTWHSQPSHRGLLWSQILECLLCMHRRSLVPRDSRSCTKSRDLGIARRVEFRMDFAFARPAKTEQYRSFFALAEGLLTMAVRRDKCPKEKRLKQS